jgi:hypothetical protein
MDVFYCWKDITQNLMRGPVLKELEVAADEQASHSRRSDASTGNDSKYTSTRRWRRSQLC